MLDIYAQEYLNNPIDETNTHFRRGDFIPEKDEDKDKPLTYYITFDGAWSLAQSADYSVFLVAGMDQDGYVYIKHVIKDRMDPLEFADTLFELVRAYDPVMVVSEKGAFANGILPAVNKKMEEEDLYFRMELFNPATDKVHRSQAIRLRARAGRIKVDKSKDWWPDFEDECLKFPRGHDDQVDAFSLVGLTINKFYEAPTQKELEKEEREEMEQEAGLFDVGRSMVTGY
jgi:predicted phage terminase large subunit-like protein